MSSLPLDKISRSSNKKHYFLLISFIPPSPPKSSKKKAATTAISQKIVIITLIQQNVLKGLFLNLSLFLIIFMQISGNYKAQRQLVSEMGESKFFATRDVLLKAIWDIKRRNAGKSKR